MKKETKGLKANIELDIDILKDDTLILHIYYNSIFIIEIVSDKTWKDNTNPDTEKRLKENWDQITKEVKEQLKEESPFEDKELREEQETNLLKYLKKIEEHYRSQKW